MLPHGLEAVVVAGDVAEMAWDAVERRRLKKRTCAFQGAASVFQEGVEMEGALAQERAENERLRAIVELYQNALAENRNSEAGRGLAGGLAGDLPLEEQGDEAAAVWTGLRRRVESPEFLSTLEAMRNGSSGLPASAGHGGSKSRSEERDGWLVISDEDVVGEPKLVEDGLGSSGYSVVTPDEVVDGIAHCVATYISSVPQAKGMSPKDLQAALAKAFTIRQKKGKLKRVWDASKVCYKFVSWSATIVGVYQHPVVIKSAAVAAWTSCKVIARVLK